MMNKSNHVFVNEENQLMDLADGSYNQSDLKELARHVARESARRDVRLVDRLGEILNYTVNHPKHVTNYMHLKGYFESMGEDVYAIQRDLATKFPDIYTHDPVPPPKPKDKPKPDKNEATNDSSSHAQKAGMNWWLIGGLGLAAAGTAYYSLFGNDDNPYS